jgi:hypothetical protein
VWRRSWEFWQDVYILKIRGLGLKVVTGLPNAGCFQKRNRNENNGGNGKKVKKEKNQQLKVNYYFIG